MWTDTSGTRQGGGVLGKRRNKKSDAWLLASQSSMEGSQLSATTGLGTELTPDAL